RSAIPEVEMKGKPSCQLVLARPPSDVRAPVQIRLDAGTEHSGSRSTQALTQAAPLTIGASATWRQSTQAVFSSPPDIQAEQCRTSPTAVRLQHDVRRRLSGLIGSSA